MIKFIDIETERTTSATDLIIMVQTLVLGLLLVLDERTHCYKGYLWDSIFFCICATSLFGVIAHGFMMSKKTNEFFWKILTLLFSSVYILIFTAISYDLFGYSASLIALAACLALGITLVVFCLKFPAFVPKIIFIGVGLGVFILAGYLYLFFKVKMAGAGFMLTAVILSFLAVIVEARQKFRIKIVWEFDHHSAYHFFQFLSNFALFFGTRIFFANLV